MPRRRRRIKEVRPEDLDDKDKAILKAMMGVGEPLTCAQIAERSGVPLRSVIGKIRGLINRRLVRRVKKGKYEITDKGREMVS